MNYLMISILLASARIVNGQEETNVKTTDQGYLVSGQLRSAGGVKIFLIENSYYKNVNTVDSTVADKAGNFSFKGKVDAPTAFLLGVKDGSEYISFILENSKISITGNADSIAGVTITGSKENDIDKRMKQLSTDIDLGALEKAYEDAISKNDKEAMRLVSFQYQRFVSRQKAVFKTFISSYPTAYASVQLLSFFADLDSLDEADSLLNLFKNATVSNPAQLSFFEKIIESRRQSSVGKYAPDFTQPDTSGKVISLSSFRGKYVLLDFWASWCLPCRKRNPNLISILKKYGSKNFVIISVSLDANREDWLQAVRKDNMAWINVSDTKATENNAKLMYGVSGIPVNYLVAPDGKIIAKIQWGLGLEDRLQALIK